MNQYFAISSEKQRCLADVINLLGVVLIRPSGRQSILIYLGPMTSALTLSAGKRSASSDDVRHTDEQRLVAILGVRISPRPMLRLVSADGRLGPDNMQIRCHIES